MIFHSSHFKVLGEETAKLAAKLANDLVDGSGVALYGNYYQDGTCSNFTNVQSSQDTHVVVGIGMATMGNLPIKESAINTDTISHEDVVRAQEEQITKLQRELSQMRGKS